MQIYARFTPNPDQLRNNLRVEKNLDFFGLVNSRSTLIVRSQASVYIDVGERLTYESTKKIYNWQSNKGDLRVHHNRLTSSRPSRAISKFVGINSGPRTTTTARPPTTWVRPPRVTCVIRKNFAWHKNFKSDLRPIYDRAESHTRPWSESRPT